VGVAVVRSGCCALSFFFVFILIVLGSSGCQDHSFHNHVLDPETLREFGSIEAQVSCSAKLKRYPIHGKHNGGWDPNVLTFTCHPHPNSSKDNSDFIKGAHVGNDLFAAKGTPLVACVDGTIVSVQNTPVGGLNITIKDSCGWYYYYAHMDSIAAKIKKGLKVTAGTYVGKVGKTGSAWGTSPHLHFSVHGGNYFKGIDPFPLLQKVDAGACAKKDDSCDDQVDEDYTNGPEICDGKDNNGNGQVDEGIPSLTCGVGACQKTVPGCVGGKVQECNPMEGAKPEVCDGVDNDCNGMLPDNELDLDQDGMMACKGDCNDGDATVFAGAAELCDGVDNDCDESTDEGLNVGENCTLGQGECSAEGVVYCNNELAAECDAPSVLPKDELCDGLDNDCDGQIDEDFGLGETCQNSEQGGCLKEGITACSNDGLQVLCISEALNPLPEICDGLDNDCNGEIDEGYDLMTPCTVGEGECMTMGYMACNAEGGSSCKAPVPDGVPELCDGKDNDCDGTADEGFSVGKSCFRYINNCPIEGVWECQPTGLSVDCVIPDDAECDLMLDPPDTPEGGNNDGDDASNDGEPTLGGESGNDWDFEPKANAKDNPAVGCVATGSSPASPLPLLAFLCWMLGIIALRRTD
jgi:hypothetical protein